MDSFEVPEQTNEPNMLNELMAIGETLQLLFVYKFTKRGNEDALKIKLTTQLNAWLRNFHVRLIIKFETEIYGPNKIISYRIKNFVMQIIPIGKEDLPPETHYVELTVYFKTEISRWRKENKFSLNGILIDISRLYNLPEESLRQDKSTGHGAAVPESEGELLTIEMTQALLRIFNLNMDDLSQ